MNTPPTHTVAGELVYWREDGVRHTRLTIAGPLFIDRLAVEEVELVFELHDATGEKHVAWTRKLGRKEVCFVDSKELALSEKARALCGSLVVWAVAPAVDPRRRGVRMLSSVDWLSDDGEICTLHNDQSARLGETATEPVELTEMVFREDEATTTSLVFVNGPIEQPERAIEIALRNVTGEERSFAYERAMAPFSVHEVRLADFVPDLPKFCRASDATITGRFLARGIYSRPYVMTTGKVTSAYHGGDRYQMRRIPQIVHRTLEHREATETMPVELMAVTAQKEMNPAYAVHSPMLTTRIHLFQSHGDIEEDFAVDATLYDRSGHIVARHERFAIAPRHGAGSIDVAELSSQRDFEGHIALRFSRDPHEFFPWRLQALMEYRTRVSVARVMLWSDRWNAPHRIRTQRPYRAAFRAFVNGPRVTTLAITNPGVSEDYSSEAPFVVRLYVGEEELVHRGMLAPNATLVVTAADLFPKRPPLEMGFVIVESPYDLASIQLTRDDRSGVVAVEHLLPIVEQSENAIYVPCGA